MKINRLGAGLQIKYTKRNGPQIQPTTACGQVTLAAGEHKQNSFNMMEKIISPCNIGLRFI